MRARVWALVPVKRLARAKLRLAAVLTPAQRRRFSRAMLEDLLNVLGRARVIEGVTIVSCDKDVIAMARAQGFEALDTGGDGGYAADVLKGIQCLGGKRCARLLILPADVPELRERELIDLARQREGVTVCPAGKDGGTNGLVFTPPLAIALRYGKHSFEKFCREARRRRVPLRVARLPGLTRDMDRPEDLLALRGQPRGNRAWRYLRSL